MDVLYMRVLCMVVHFCMFVVEWSACLLNAGGYGELLCWMPGE